MAVLGWLGPVRSGFRRGYMTMLARTLETDDVRQMLLARFRGLTESGEVPKSRVPYPELGTSNPPEAGCRPIFITGRFRSGSTLLWNLFRHVPDCRSYYEPLNERRWFDPSMRGDRVDRTHLGVDNYWQEYDGLASLGRWYREEWTCRRLYMRAGDVDDGLRAYVQGLIDAAPRTAVLQFNRVDFRLAWLRRWFPEAHLIHIYRHPRDQWCSTLVDPARFPYTSGMAEFAARDYFYLLPWCRDLAAWYPFLAPEGASHPYQLFYYLWRLSFAHGQQYAHTSVEFETLVASPASEIRRIMDDAGMSGYDLERLQGLVRPQGSRWAQYAPVSWFEEIEARCEDTLAAAAG